MDSRSASLIEPSNGVPLGSDLAEVHPNRDAFGYKTFAQAIARAALTTPSPAGLVLAIEGPWGAGKTTLLNFVKHYLTDRDSGLAELSIEERPAVVEFNPWWIADGALAFPYKRSLRRPIQQDIPVSRTNDES
jgi:hypothetical protein